MTHDPSHPAAEACGCDDFTTSRRRFLQGAAALTGAGVLTAVHGSAFTTVAMAQESVASNVLVVLSMRGGVDGLSLVVPYTETALVDLRPNIGIPEGILRCRDGQFGLHPGFEPMEDLWTAGKFAAVHAVGMKEPNRSHFDATEELEDADPGSEKRVGWLNRMIALDEIADPLQAVQMGSPIVPTSLFGKQPVLAVAHIDDMFLPASEWGYKRRKSALKEAWRGVDTPLGRGSRSALKVSKEFEKLSDADALPQNGAEYAAGDLGTAFAETARLIRANLGAKVVTIDCGSWDLHTAVGDAGGGAMGRMVGDLATNIAAFFVDLGTTAERVTLVTISEFGRRAAENANRGLDHGYANVMLLAGAGVIGGKYYANAWPGLATDQLRDGDLEKTIDYRSVLADVVQSRFSADISKVFPGLSRDTIKCMVGV